MNTLLVSFIYPEIEPFLEDFFRSLNNQSSNKFDSLMFIDRLEIDFDKYNYDDRVIYNKNELGICETRKYIIEYGIENNYDLLVFIDADDTMEQFRLEKIIKSYNDKISFFYNDLYLLSNKNYDFFKGKMPKTINDFNKIKKYNFLGMSHTAININKEKDTLIKMPIPENLIAFDWYLHSFLLKNGGNGKKVDTKTFYRIYDNNIAGNTQVLTSKKLDVGIKVKKYHYLAMREFDNSYNRLYNKILHLEDKLNQNNLRKRYIEYINKELSESVFWWENIKTLDEINIR